MIKQIHRLWLGPRQMPDVFKSYGADWQSLNPDWTLTDSSWQNLPEDFRSESVLDFYRAQCSSNSSTELPTTLADVIAYELVWRFGGVYTNADIQPIRPRSLIAEQIEAGHGLPSRMSTTSSTPSSVRPKRSIRSGTT